MSPFTYTFYLDPIKAIFKELKAHWITGNNKWFASDMSIACTITPFKGGFEATARMLLK